MNKQTVLDVLNRLEIIESQGGDEAYAIVELNEENLAELAEVGITKEMVEGYGTDGEDFCILAYAFNEGLADYHQNGKLYLFGEIDDELRQRVISGEGNAIDAEHLLRVLEPELFTA